MTTEKEVGGYNKTNGDLVREREKKREKGIDRSEKRGG